MSGQRYRQREACENCEHSYQQAYYEGGECACNLAGDKPTRETSGSHFEWMCANKVDHSAICDNYKRPSWWREGGS